MSWFLNLKIAHKLALSFSVCLFFALLSGLAGIQRMTAMNNNTHSITDKSMRRISLISKFMIDQKEYRTSILELIVASDNKQIDQIESVIVGAKQVCDTDLQNYRSKIRDKDDAESFNKLNDLWNQIGSYQAEIFKGARANNTAIDNKIIFQDTGPVYRSVRDQAQSIIDWNTSQATGALKTADDSYRDGVKIVLILLGIGMAAGIFMATIATSDMTRTTRKFAEQLEQLNITFQDNSAVAEAMAQGDLTHKDVRRTDYLRWTRKDEFGDLARVFDKMLGNGKKTTDGIRKARIALSKMIGNVSSSVEKIAMATGELAMGNQNLAERTSSQAASLEETAASMEEMAGTVMQNADNTKQASEMAVRAEHIAEGGGAIVVSAVESMGGISSASRKISEIVSVIDEIAFQTNLLALNAAVEAARVGAQGKGFAVVASEVRELAGRSSKAAKEIKLLVKESVERVEHGAKLVHQSGDHLKEIVSSVHGAARMITDISTSAAEQSIGIDQVNKAVIQLDEITQQNASLVEEANVASSSLGDLTLELAEAIAKFQIDSEDSSAANDRQLPLAA
jgi:methyl-accepting chemotaxis protein